MESKKLSRFVWSAATLISMTLWDISGALGGEWSSGYRVPGLAIDSGACT
ncbi:hypothetical protein FOFC_11137 [Fusarium oxysporum]|nr:hypothetical protein FOFC_11137 [Fusarium oxysporum]